MDNWTHRQIKKDRWGGSLRKFSSVTSVSLVKLRGRLSDRNEDGGGGAGGLEREKKRKTYYLGEQGRETSIETQYDCCHQEPTRS